MQDDRTDRLDKAKKRNKTKKKHIAFIVANANPEYKIPMSKNTKKKSGGKGLGLKRSQTEVTYTDRRGNKASGNIRVRRHKDNNKSRQSTKDQ